MPIGKMTSCPWCQTVHLWADTTHGRFCTDYCKAVYEAADKATLHQSNEVRDRMIDEMNRRAAEEEALRLARVSPKTVFCNRCVTFTTWMPTVDGSTCDDCGFPLSFYGPFDPHPTNWRVASQLLHGFRPEPRPLWSASLPCVTQRNA